MNKNNTARALLGAINLITVSSPMLVNQVSYAATTDQKIEKLNVASLKSIESSWIKVPIICKARAFNASPVQLEDQVAASHVQSIYESFGV